MSTDLVHNRKILSERLRLLEISMIDSNALIFVDDSLILVLATELLSLDFGKIETDMSRARKHGATGFFVALRRTQTAGQGIDRLDDLISLANHLNLAFIERLRWP